MERNYEYQKPPENTDLLHKIVLEIDGKNVGEAKLEYRNQPFPFYYIDLIYVDDGEKGKGYGRDLFEKVNEFLRQERKPGILLNAIKRKSPARGMYARHGWVDLKNHEDWMGHGLDGIEQGKIDQAIYEIDNRHMRDQKEQAA